MSKQFPTIQIDGDPVRARDHVEKGTGLVVFGAFVVAIVGSIVIILATMGIGLIGLILYPIITYFTHKKAIAMIHGSGILVGEDQFPEIHESLLIFKQRLEIEKEISVYIVEANIINAFAVKYGKKNVILLTDDLINGCLDSDNPAILSFIIAHELGHVALEHNSVLRSWMSQIFKKLGRLDEYSADSVATALVNDKAIAYKGLLLLTVGHALMPYINLKNLAVQSQEVAANKYSKKAEKPLTHPLLLNRLHRILQQS